MLSLRNQPSLHILVFVYLLFNCNPLLAKSCRRLFVESGIYSVLPHWNSQFESKLTYKLTQEQVATMDKITSESEYRDWLKEFLANGWRSEMLQIEQLPQYLFRAYWQGTLSVHEFMTGMFFNYSRREAGPQRNQKLIQINEKNIEYVLDHVIFPLTASDRAEFKKRLFQLPPQERVYLILEGLPYVSYLTRFSMTGGLSTGENYEMLQRGLNFSGAYRVFSPTWTRVVKKGDLGNSVFNGSILSASVRQILSDLVHKENSVQHVAVIGKENSFDMAETFALGGRSIAMPFPDIVAHPPHEVDSNRYPLTAAFHDYFHNEVASTSSASSRKTVVPYILKLIKSQVGRTWENLTLMYAQNGVEQNAQFLTLKHKLKFLGAQESVESFTDLERPFDLGAYINELAHPTNLHIDIFSNEFHGIDNYVVVAIIFEDMRSHPEVWKKIGYGPEWFQHFINSTANYRTRFIYSTRQ